MIKTFHDSTFGGHSGQLGILKRLKKLFYWPLMKQMVIDYVSRCDVCKRSKDENVTYPGLLQPLPIPNQAWRDISMDFIKGLPSSKGKDTILVVVDRLTKSAHFIALSHPFTAAQVAEKFWKRVHALHGIPETIVTDRDKIFLSNFWQAL